MPVVDASMSFEGDPEINPSTYQWSVRLFSIVRKVLGVNVKLHHDEGQVAAGDIFLFNHFARFETFIPQYLIYEETGAYCRSVASGEFFVQDDALSKYLVGVGAVPNDYPRLLPLLAEEVLRGRKVIVFPEGGMVKDRQVQDSKGRYSVYSRVEEVRRKHHTGAAVLGLALDAFKTTVMHAHARGDMRRIKEWARVLRIESAEALLAAARRPTLIVPANITFYPIRVSDNMLRKGADMLNRGLSRRMSEELLIEGNILLKHTDMDIRLGDPVRPAHAWRWWERRLIAPLVGRLESLDELFALTPRTGRWDARILARGMRRRAMRVRDEYMHGMYSGVTLNLSHLASSVVMAYVDRGETQVDRAVFQTALYLTVKHAQTKGAIHLHRSLRNPEAYRGLLDGDCEGLRQFIRTTTSMDLVARDAHSFQFLSKLREEHAFDEIRLENLVAVYANEVSPIPAVDDAVARALKDVPDIEPERVAQHRFDDERLELAWDRFSYTKPRHHEINRHETATESADPFLLLPESPRAIAVVLVHGFLASPAEVRDFGERLASEGYRVIGVRLKGHGTSPWDLRERSWEDWMESVRRGYEIMSAFTDRICLVGFSTGAALCLRFAADRPAKLAAVVAVAAPMKFRNRNMVFVPLVHRANRLVRWVSGAEGIVPFRPNDTEHPEINYRNMPVRGLYELRRMVDELDRRLADVQCPVAVLQGDADPVVDPKSAELIRDRIGGDTVSVFMVASERHGILHNNIGGTQERILTFLDELTRPRLSHVQDDVVDGSA